MVGGVKIPLWRLIPLRSFKYTHHMHNRSYLCRTIYSDGASLTFIGWWTIIKNIWKKKHPYWTWPLNTCWSPYYLLSNRDQSYKLKFRDEGWSTLTCSANTCPRISVRNKTLSLKTYKGTRDATAEPETRVVDGYQRFWI